MAMPDCVKTPYCNGKATSLHEVELEHSCAQQLLATEHVVPAAGNRVFTQPVAFLQNQPG